MRTGYCRKYSMFSKFGNQMIFQIDTEWRSVRSCNPKSIVSTRDTHSIECTVSYKIMDKKFMKDSALSESEIIQASYTCTHPKPSRTINAKRPCRRIEQIILSGQRTHAYRLKFRLDHDNT